MIVLCRKKHGNFGNIFFSSFKMLSSKAGVVCDLNLVNPWHSSFLLGDNNNNDEVLRWHSTISYKHIPHSALRRGYQGQGTTSSGAQCRKGVTIYIQNVPSLAHLCTAGQDLTLTDCLVSSLRLIGANFNDLMKQRTINISNISIATTRCCLLPPRVLSAVFRLVL